MERQESARNSGAGNNERKRSGGEKQVFHDHKLSVDLDPVDLFEKSRAVRAVSSTAQSIANLLTRDASGGWERDLLGLFVRNQLRVSLALPFLAILFAIASMGWTSISNLGLWLTGVLLFQAIQLVICRLYEQSGADHSGYRDWVGMLAASEVFFAACWALPLYLFWQPGNGLQHIFMISVLMTVVAVRILIAANFMPVMLAGTGLITLAIVTRCIMEGAPLYIIMGTIAIIVEIFFIQLSRRLQSTARDMLIFKSQREKLIDELQKERDRADRARRRAEEASRAKSRFLATMSHELRTPLNAIMGFSEIISGEMLGPLSVPQYKDYAGDIHQSGNYLLSLINDILDLSRIEAGRRELREEAVDITAEAEESMHLVAIKVKEKNQRLTGNLAKGLPSVLGDSRAIRQMWINLLSNAIKFTPEGGRIELAARRMDNGAIVMSVSDDGEGIPAGELKAVTKSFSRGASAIASAVEGAGLGLPIVNGLARLHDAELTISTESGKGTKVSITFPPRRVLEGSRAEILAAGRIKSPSQRRLIALTA